MGASCCKSSGARRANAGADGGTLKVMFDRFDKEHKGYISIHNLQDMMRDDKTHFHGTDASRIMEKYGTDGKMMFLDFKLWWESTYTTYSSDDLQRIVEEVRNENSIHMDTIEELPEPLENTSVAISRS